MIGKNKQCPHNSGICNIVRMHEVAAENNFQAAVRAAIPDTPDELIAQVGKPANIYLSRADHHRAAYTNNSARLPDVAERCGSCLVGEVTSLNNWENIL